MSSRASGSAWAVAVLLVSFFLASSTTYSQETPLAEMGRTSLQRATGNAVTRVCNGFSENQDADTSREEDLFDRCTELINTTVGEEEGNLQIGQDQLANALQNVASEEVSTMGTAATETISRQLANLAARFRALRMGARGFNLASLRFKRPDIRRGVLGRSARAGRRQSGSLSGGGGTIRQGKLGGFLNGVVEFGDKEGTAREDAFDFNATNITAGIDYRVTEHGVIGVAGGYNNLNTDFDKTNTVAGGGIDANGYTFSGYGTHHRGPFFNYALVSYSRNDYDLRREVVIPTGSGATGSGANRTAKADTESDQLATTVGSTVGLSHGAWTYGPYVRLDYLNLDIDGYTERGARGLNLDVDGQDVESLTSVLGGRFSYAFSHRFGVLVPQIRAGWIHQFLDDSREITARFASDPRNNLLVAKTNAPDRNYATLGAGTSLVFRGGTQGFVNYRTLLGLRNIDDHTVTVGVRHQF